MLWLTWLKCNLHSGTSTGGKSELSKTMATSNEDTYMAGKVEVLDSGHRDREGCVKNFIHIYFYFLLPCIFTAECEIPLKQ